MEEKTVVVAAEPLIVEPPVQPKKVVAKKVSKKVSKKSAKKSGKKSAKKVSASKKNAHKKISILQAAFKVLQRSKKSMCLKDILTVIYKRHLWASKHHSQTVRQGLSAAIQRSILKKGSRIRRAGRGLFAVKK